MFNNARATWFEGHVAKHIDNERCFFFALWSEMSPFGSQDTCMGEDITYYHRFDRFLRFLFTRETFALRMLLSEHLSIRHKMHPVLLLTSFKIEQQTFSEASACNHNQMLSRKKSCEFSVVSCFSTSSP